MLYQQGGIRQDNLGSLQGWLNLNLEANSSPELGATTFTATTISIITSSIITVSIKGLYVKHSLCDSRHTWHSAQQCSAISECHYDEYHILFIIKVNVIMLSVVMLSVVMLTVIMMTVIMLCVVMLSVIMLRLVAPTIISMFF